MMTLDQATTILHIHCTSSHNAGWKEKREAWEVVRSHLSQPQPVAQGEAVAWQRRDRITHGGGDAPGWSHWREVGRYEFAEHNGKYPHIEFRELFATPTIPTGHRVVPVEPSEAYTRGKHDGQMSVFGEVLQSVFNAVHRFDECCEDGEDVDLGRDWLDALTTIGAIERVQKSPARWIIAKGGMEMLHGIPITTAECFLVPAKKILELAASLRNRQGVAIHLREAARLVEELAASPSAGGV
jgi:hypothetical protein